MIFIKMNFLGIAIYFILSAALIWAGVAFLGLFGLGTTSALLVLILLK